MPQVANPLPAEFLRVGEPSPFTLRNRSGMVVVPRGSTVDSNDLRDRLLEGGLFLDQHDHGVMLRVLAGKVAHLVEGNAMLGRIAQAQPDAADVAAATGGPRTVRRRLEDPLNRWSNIQFRLRGLLLDPSAPEWVSRLEDLQFELKELLRSDPDDTLLTLIYPASRLAQNYSASHATLVAAVVHLARVYTPGWDFAWDASLRSAALTMNIAMTQLQNDLAMQTTPVSPVQRKQIDAHAAAGAQMLRDAGVGDELVLAAVAAHHSAAPGDWAAMTPAMRVARLIARADLFCAQLSPRRSRAARSAQAAARAAYLGEDGQPDVAGSAILKAIGLYPAGSLVQLRNGEVGVVLRRSPTTGRPIVATVQNAQGMGLTDPLLRRDPSGPHEIVKALAPGDVKVLLNVEKLLALG